MNKWTIKKKANIPNEIMQKIESYANEQGYIISVIGDDNFNVIPKNKNSDIIQINVYYPKKSFSIVFNTGSILGMEGCMISDNNISNFINELNQVQDFMNTLLNIK